MYVSIEADVQGEIIDFDYPISTLNTFFVIE